MTISRIKKLLILATAIIFTVSFSLALSITAFAGSVSAGSSLFTEIDNVTITSSTDGLELSSTGIQQSSAKYVNKLYLGNFGFKYIVSGNNFSYLTLTFISKNNSLVSGTIKDIENVLKLSNKDGKLAISLNGAAEITTTKDFANATEINFNKTTDEFSINGIADSFKADGALDINEDEAYVKIAFYGIEMGKTAGITIKEINGQSFISSTVGYIEDDTAPVMKVDASLLCVSAPVAIQYELPIYGLDVISSSLKYEVILAYAADGVNYDTNKITKTTLKFPLDKVGKYKIESIKISDGNGNSTVTTTAAAADAKCIGIDLFTTPIIIQTTEWNINYGENDEFNPVMTTFDGGVSQAAYISEISMYIIGGGSNKFQFKTPVVTVNCTPAGVTEKAELIDFIILYKSPSSTVFSKYDGLIFTASLAGDYQFKLQAIDRMGNRSEESPVMYITFYDETAPKIMISGFSAEEYINQSLTLPSGTITDDMDSSPASTIEVYYIKDADGNFIYEKDADGNIVYKTDDNGVVLKDDQGNDIKKKLLVSETYTFNPDTLGWYEVRYTAEDASGNSTTLSPMTFKIIEAAAPVAVTESFIDLTDTWTIILLSIAGVSAIGIIILLFIKPKEE